MVLVQSPSADSKPFHLAIWVGPELKINQLLQPPFVSQSAYDSKHPSGSGSKTGPIVAVAIVVVLIAIVIVAMRRRKQGAAR